MPNFQAQGFQGVHSWGLEETSCSLNLQCTVAMAAATVVAAATAVLGFPPFSPLALHLLKYTHKQ